MSSNGTWNERISTLEQERTFKRLIALHTLTDAWVKTISPQSEPTHRIERMTKVTLNPNLWLFEKMRLDQIPLELEKLVSAQSIDDFLKELKNTIWIIQVSTLENALGQGTSTLEMENILQQTSWNHGRAYAESIWGTSGSFALQEAYDAFCASHWYGQNDFLTETRSELEIRLIWRNPPSENPSIKTSEGAPLLCTLHEHWIRGFFYGVSRKVKTNIRSTTLRERPYPTFTLLSTY